MKRLLVTGSRHWRDLHIIETALVAARAELGDDTVLVQGECHLGGADLMAKILWEDWGLPTEGHPADRDDSGRLLGPERNQKMIDLGADLCVAFPLRGSRGTRNCMRLAREAGIPVRVFEDPRG